MGNTFGYLRENVGNYLGKTFQDGINPAIRNFVGSTHGKLLTLGLLGGATMVGAKQLHNYQNQAQQYANSEFFGKNKPVHQQKVDLQAPEYAYSRPKFELEDADDVEKSSGGGEPPNPDKNTKSAKGVTKTASAQAAIASAPLRVGEIVAAHQPNFVVPNSDDACGDLIKRNGRLEYVMEVNRQNSFYLVLQVQEQGLYDGNWSEIELPNLNTGLYQIEPHFLNNGDKVIHTTFFDQPGRDGLVMSSRNGDSFNFDVTQPQILVDGEGFLISTSLIDGKLSYSDRNNSKKFTPFTDWQDGQLSAGQTMNGFEDYAGARVVLTNDPGIALTSAPDGLIHQNDINTANMSGANFTLVAQAHGFNDPRYLYGLCDFENLGNGTAIIAVTSDRPEIPDAPPEAFFHTWFYEVRLNNQNPDGDNDGVPDDTDNCPTVPNQNQANADGDNFGDACDNCPADINNDQDNSDNDSWGDACDNCPGDDNQDQEDIDGDGFGDACDPCNFCPEDDRDSDGVLDDLDNCPDTPNPNQEDCDFDDIGDFCDQACNCCNGNPNDTDGDGVADDTDNCFTIPNPDQANYDEDAAGDACDGCKADPGNVQEGQCEVCVPEIYFSGQSFAAVNTYEGYDGILRLTSNKGTLVYAGNPTCLPNGKLELTFLLDRDENEQADVTIDDDMGGRKPGFLTTTICFADNEGDHPANCAQGIGELFMGTRDSEKQAQRYTTDGEALVNAFAHRGAATLYKTDNSGRVVEETDLAEGEQELVYEESGKPVDEETRCALRNELIGKGVDDAAGKLNQVIGWLLTLSPAAFAAALRRLRGKKEDEESVQSEAAEKGL